MRVERSQLSTAAVLLLFVTFFFSVFLQQLAAVGGWISAFAPARKAGDRSGAGFRWLPAGLAGPYALFLAASGVSASFGLAPADGWRVVGKELFALGYALAAVGILRLGQARAAVGVLLAGAAVAGAWSIYQVVFDYGGVFNYHYRTHGFWHRYAFISYANVLAMTFALALGLLGWGRAWRRGLVVTSACMAVVGMVTSYTRASWLVTFGLVTWASLRRRAVVPLVAMAVLVAAVLLIPATDATQELVARARSSFNINSEQNIDRVVRYRMAVAVIRDYPLLGTGPDAFKLVHARYALPGVLDNWHLHNTYLQLLAERGPLALGTWLLTMIWAAVHAFRAAGRAGPERAGLAVGVGLVLVAMLLLGIFNYVWEDWRVRSLALAFVGLAWSPAVTGPEADGAEAGGASGG